jgi:NADPH-dependent 2,4-dienoyl-CoA reductase/sulfur reductase-like enzyme
LAERLVVIGGDAAGMSAASQARRRREPDDLEIVAFERGNFFSYSACGIPYHVGGVVSDLDRLIVRRIDDFRKKDIDARVRHEVVDIDLASSAVTVRDLDGGREFSEPFDHLMYAAGAIPIRLTDDEDLRGIFGIQTLDDGIALIRAIESAKPSSAVVVGGGYIGLEMAEALVERDIDVTLIESAPQPMATLDPDMGELVARAMRDVNIEVITDEPVTGFIGDGGRVAAVVTDEREVRADVVVLGLGVRPNVELAAAAGIPIGVSGAVQVDNRLRTRAENVWSAGDCAEKFHLVSRRAVAVPLGTHANKEGRVAGINLGGGDAEFPGVLGTAASKICNLEIARTGLNEREATDAGVEWLSNMVESTDRAGYWPGKSSMRVKVVFERDGGRLLGAQIVGGDNAAKRIDVFAVALNNNMSVAEIQHLDLSYAPPFSPVWDPVLIAARKAADLI